MNPGTNSTVRRLVTLPERLAAMRCLRCEHDWQDIEAAINQYPVPCPVCRRGSTEPVYDVDGKSMPEGWMLS